MPPPEPLQGPGRGEARREGRKKGGGTLAVLPSLLTPLCARSCNRSRISGSLCAQIPHPETSPGLLPAINPPPERAGRRLPTSSKGTAQLWAGWGQHRSLPAELLLTPSSPPGWLEVSRCCPLAFPNRAPAAPAMPQLSLGRCSYLLVREASGEQAHRPPPFPAPSPRRATRASPPHRHPAGLGTRPLASLISGLKEPRALQCSERRGRGRKQNRHPQERDKAGRANKGGRERGEGEVG